MSDDAEDPLSQSLLRAQDIDATPVYPIIHMIRQDMTHFIDAPLTYDAMMAPDLTYTLIRPLEEKYIAIQHKGNRSVVFCFLLNRVHFLRDQNLATTPLSRSRAALCEILAIRTLREYGEDILELALAITTTWSIYAGVDKELLRQSLREMDVEDPEERVGNAIEMAIISKSKRFIKSTACQRVIDGIWSGRCVYQAQSSHSILSDTYKRNPIHLYDPHKAPLLDHYRLKVPAVRSVLEYFNFIILFVLFVIALEFNELDRLNAAESIFMLYALGFSLEKLAAMQEHGLKVYFKGTWNGFDLAFITIYCSYASLRIYGIEHHNSWARTSGLDCLALAACLIFPRLMFVTLKNNLMVLSLRAMIIQFIILMCIAVFCFAGFLYALWTLSRNDAHYSAGQIAWWMADLWFGLDASGFEKATSFHPFFGPLLMVAYACLSNTLLLTVLVSILSHTFSTISEDAEAEAMFRRAVSTIEGVKADSLFSYQPPINLVALMIMLPASYILSPRWFHKFNVFMIRLTSFPILLCIAIYERQSKRVGSTSFSETLSSAAEQVFDVLPRPLKRLTFFEGLFSGAGFDIDLIFEIEEDMTNKHARELDLRAMQATDSQPTQARPASAQAESAPSPTSLSPEAKDIPSPSPSVQPAPEHDTTSGSPLGNAQHVRPRVGSMMHRATGSRAEDIHSFTSPLAQIYQPLVVDDDLVEEDGPESVASPSKTQQQFAFPRRRRLSSMHKFPPSDVHIAAVPLRKFPTNSSSRGPVSVGILDQPVSESPFSPDSDTAPAIGREPETVEETANEEANLGPDPRLTDRLERIEKQQKRLEELILQIAKDLHR